MIFFLPASRLVCLVICKQQMVSDTQTRCPQGVLNVEETCNFNEAIELITDICAWRGMMC